MRIAATIVAIAISVVGCGVAAEEATTPSVPAALIGCWTLNDPDKDEFIREELRIEATQMHVFASWMETKRTELTLDRVESQTGNSFRGLVSFPENGGAAPYATEMGIGIRGAPADRLVVVEGDAGSRWFSRCERDG